MAKSTITMLRVPAFQDNYLWLICDSALTQCYVVDPGDAKAILDTLDRHGLALAGILITHHHPDHIGGISQLKAKYDVPVYGPATESIPHISHSCTDGELITLPELGISLQVLFVPGHTNGHIAYYCAEHNSLFCGDTLFAGGCGKLFEGTPKDMASSLSKIAALPDDTTIYCAHEYTAANLSFAASVDINNPALFARQQSTNKCRQYDIATVPSNLRHEKMTNPFLRCHTQDIQQVANSTDPVDTFAAIRAMKDSFRG